MKQTLESAAINELFSVMLVRQEIYHLPGLYMTEMQC